MAEALRNDPLVHRRITGRMFKEAQREQLKAFTSGWPPDLPGLFLIPTDDRVVRSDISTTFARAIVGAPIQVEILEGRRHEPLNDIGREEVFRIVLDWLVDCPSQSGGVKGPKSGNG
jgi:alpha-beta hydrolase superfamily lysophospholipase